MKDYSEDGMTPGKKCRREKVRKITAKEQTKTIKIQKLCHKFFELYF